MTLKELWNELVNTPVTELAWFGILIVSGLMLLGLLGDIKVNSDDFTRDTFFGALLVSAPIIGTYVLIELFS